MVDSDKIVSLNSLVEHTDFSVLKNILRISGGPSSIAQAGNTVVYPNRVIKQTDFKVKIKKTKPLIMTGKFGNFKNREQLPTTEYENPLLLPNGQGILDMHVYVFICLYMYVYMYIIIVFL
jgi:hypothetical protein